MRSSKKIFFALLFINALTFCFPANSMAGMPNGEMLQMLQKKDVPDAENPPAPANPPVIEQKEEVIKGIKLTPGMKILVRKFRVEGNTLLDKKTIDSILVPNENKKLTIENLQTIAEILTAQYRDRGYILANAFIPAQHIKDGVVIIKVVEGKIGKINVSGNKSYSTDFILRYLRRLQRDGSPTEDQLERPLLILNNYPSLNVRTVLKTGQEPGTADMDVTVTDRFPISGSIAYDNFGDKTTSKNRLTASVDAGNLLTSGDLLSVQGVTGLDSIDINKLGYVRAGYAVPVGGSGTTVDAAYTNSLYRAGEAVAVLGLNGKANIYSLGLSYPLIVERDGQLNLRLSFDYKDVIEYLLGQVDSHDKIRVANIDVSYQNTDRFLGRNFIGFGYHQGLGSFLGGTTTTSSTEPVSRPDADPTFSKFTLDLLRVQKLPGYNYLVLRGSGQYTPDRLFVAEEFLLGGEGSVRGFTPATYGGDSGYSASAELVLSPILADKTIFKQKVGETIKFAFFADTGGVFTNSIEGTETPHEYLTSIGTGIRLFGGRNFMLRLDYALPEGTNGEFTTRTGEVYVQSVLSF